MFRAILYIIAIVTANVVTATFAPMVVGPFIVPYGTIFVGITFILRDLVQLKLGKKNTYYIIVVALLISIALSFFFGDLLMVTLASALSFLVSEVTDTEIFSRMKASFITRVMISGFFGGILDSTLFVIIGLSPIGINALPWVAVPSAIIGQIIVKGTMQVIGALFIKLFIKKEVYTHG